MAPTAADRKVALKHGMPDTKNRTVLDPLEVGSDVLGRPAFFGPYRVLVARRRRVVAAGLALAVPGRASAAC